MQQDAEKTLAADFLSFCLTPVLAAEARLRPIGRFGVGAEIVLSRP
jgi:hypothetical protein